VPEVTTEPSSTPAAAPSPTEFDLVRHYFEALKPLEGTPTDPRMADLTLGQLRLLLVLQFRGAFSMGEVAAKFGLSNASASGFVGRIERHGLIERSTRADDRRVVEVRLTDEGRRLLTEIAGLRTEQLRAGLATLSEEERATLDRLLVAMAERRDGRPETPR
jgi:DNA-binding MarR family transcriptional regulator